MNNPYWETLRSSWPRDEIMWKWKRKFQPGLLSVPHELLGVIPRDQVKDRWDICREYAWSIPDPISLEFVASHLGARAIEIGAGTGYYASMLAQHGTHVICYDSHPPQRSTENWWCSPAGSKRLLGQLRPVYQEVYWGGPGKAAHYTYPLFLCWPPMSGMAYKTLKAYAGNKLVYIGEGNGGCTADEAFFELLDRRWNEIDSHQPVQWSGIHDEITVYERKRN